jgi:hypothetical protein
MTDGWIVLVLIAVVAVLILFPVVLKWLFAWLVVSVLAALLLGLFFAGADEGGRR